MNGSQRTPLLVTAFFGAVAWALTHSVDRLSEVPIIAYEPTITSVLDPKHGSLTRVLIALENLSRSTRFENVVVVLRRSSKTADTLFENDFAMADLVGVPPAPTVNIEVAVSSEAVQFVIPSMPPLTRYQIVAHYQGADSPVLTGGHTTGAPYVLKHESLQTFVLRHELSLIWSTLGLWLLLVFVYFCCTRAQNTPLERQGRDA